MQRTARGNFAAAWARLSHTLSPLNECSARKLFRAVRTSRGGALRQCAWTIQLQQRPLPSLLPSALWEGSTLSTNSSPGSSMPPVLSVSMPTKTSPCYILSAVLSALLLTPTERPTRRSRKVRCMSVATVAADVAPNAPNGRHAMIALCGPMLPRKYVLLSAAPRLAG